MSTKYGLIVTLALAFALAYGTTGCSDTAGSGSGTSTGAQPWNEQWTVTLHGTGNPVVSADLIGTMNSSANAGRVAGQEQTVTAQQLGTTDIVLTIAAPCLAGTFTLNTNAGTVVATLVNGKGVTEMHTISANGVTDSFSPTCQYP